MGWLRSDLDGPLFIQTREVASVFEQHYRHYSDKCVVELRWKICCRVMTRTRDRWRITGQAVDDCWKVTVVGLGVEENSRSIFRPRLKVNFELVAPLRMWSIP